MKVKKILYEDLQNIYFCCIAKNILHDNLLWIRAETYTEIVYCGIIRGLSEFTCYPKDITEIRVKKRLKNLMFSVDFDLLEITVDLIAEQLIKWLEDNDDKARQVTSTLLKPDLTDEHRDIWIESLSKRSEKDVTVETCGCDFDGMTFLKIIYPESQPFYAKYYEASPSATHIMVSLPGYNAEWHSLKAYMNQGYNILQISPLGYNTPNGYENSLKVRGAWPVLYDTVSEFDEDIGYYKWFENCVVAINQIRKPFQKLIFIGTSQGGAASLILSSIYKDLTDVCAAEMPFMLGFSDNNYQKVRSFVINQYQSFEKFIYDDIARERLYLFDPYNHRDRIQANCLLLAGELDYECPKCDIKFLYDELICNKKYVELPGQGHGYTKEFEEIAKKWIKKVIFST